MSDQLTLVIAQLNFLVGDVEGNAKRIIDAANQAKNEHQADVVVFPELTLSGYPAQDLWLRPGLYWRINAALTRILDDVQGIDVILGYPSEENNRRYNTASLLRDGQIISSIHKQHLPNYGVFDEARYFQTPQQPCCTVDIKGVKTAITICEDLWHPQPMADAKASGAQLMISLNASPYDRLKPSIRQQTITARAQEGQMPIIYANLVGGQDELVFDGGSMAMSKEGTILHQAPYYVEAMEVIHLSTDPVTITSRRLNPETSDTQRIYEALVLGVRDYIEKNRFPGALVGASGGIDSALTLAIAVDAIGPDRVEAVLMPSRYTRDISITDAKEQADLLKIKHQLISIEPVFQAFLTNLAPSFEGLATDTTEENLQARCRGMTLMALSNKKGSIVLSTGNKSELSVGYATLYGDMVGGFCVLKDVPKTLVYELANYRNGINHVIPQRIIDREPSAELAADQYDQDSLPDYPTLDQILARYIEQDECVDSIIAAGFEQETVRKVVRMVERNEYKRHQAPIGVRISQKAFGRDRRYPITSGYGRLYDKENDKLSLDQDN